MQSGAVPHHGKTTALHDRGVNSTFVPHHAPAFLLNSSAFEPDAHVTLGTAFIATYHAASLNGSKSSWKPGALESFTPIMTSSSAHCAPVEPGETRVSRGTRDHWLSDRGMQNFHSMPKFRRSRFRDQHGPHAGKETCSMHVF